MDKNRKAKIAAFVKKRDEMLMAGDIDLMMAFHAKHNPGIQPFRSREVAEIALHKARTACRTIPIDARVLSKNWLAARGYESMDDGDLSSTLSKGHGGIKHGQ